MPDNYKSPTEAGCKMTRQYAMSTTSSINTLLDTISFIKNSINKPKQDGPQTVSVTLILKPLLSIFWVLRLKESSVLMTDTFTKEKVRVCFNFIGQPSQTQTKESMEVSSPTSDTFYMNTSTIVPKILIGWQVIMNKSKLLCPNCSEDKNNSDLQEMTLNNSSHRNLTFWKALLNY